MDVVKKIHFTIRVSFNTKVILFSSIFTIEKFSLEDGALPKVRGDDVKCQKDIFFHNLTK